MTDHQFESRGVNRRTVLKTTGMATMGIAAFSGTASATPPTEIRFCGCSQICFQATDGPYRIFFATETEDGYDCRLEPDLYSGLTESTCVTAGEDEKIIGLLNGGRRFFANPNNCAQRALDDVDLTDCTGYSDDVAIEHMTYSQVSRHEYIVDDPQSDNVDSVTVRTRQCKPPSQWDDDPNGPPESRGGGPPEDR